MDPMFAAGLAASMNAGNDLSQADVTSDQIAERDDRIPVDQRGHVAEIEVTGSPPFTAVSAFVIVS
jgi:hypothetical protein